MDRQQQVRQLMIELRRLNRLMRARTSTLRHEFTPAQMTVLHLLAERGAMRASDLAHETGLSASSMTGLLDRLETEQMVERRRGQEDRREVAVRMTERATAMLEEAHAEIEREIEHLFAPLSDEELAAIVRLSHKLSQGDD